MSQSLVWHLIRDNNSFLVKRGRTSRVGAVNFSTEAGNLLNAHSFKYSGVANFRAVDVSTDLAVKTKNEKEHNKPSKTFNAAETLSYRFPKKAATKIAAIVGATRGDLVSAAKARVARAIAGVRATKGVRGRKHKSVQKRVVKTARSSK